MLKQTEGRGPEKELNLKTPLPERSSLTESGNCSAFQPEEPQRRASALTGRRPFTSVLIG